MLEQVAQRIGRTHALRKRQPQRGAVELQFEPFRVASDAAPFPVGSAEELGGIEPHRVAVIAVHVGKNRGLGREEFGGVAGLGQNVARMECVRLATEHPAEPGELRVYNQFTEQFAVLELAERVRHAAAALGIEASIEHRSNPRKELETHYYNAKHTKLLDLGLEPRLLNDELIDTMLVKIRDHADRINASTLVQNVRWVPESSASAVRESSPA